VRVWESHQGVHEASAQGRDLSNRTEGELATGTCRHPWLPVAEKNAADGVENHSMAPEHLEKKATIDSASYSGLVSWLKGWTSSMDHRRPL